jgi:hypothetical protein
MASGMCYAPDWQNGLLVEGFVTSLAHALWLMEHEKVSSVLTAAAGHMPSMAELNETTTMAVVSPVVAHCTPWRAMHVMEESPKAMPVGPFLVVADNMLCRLAHAVKKLSPDAAGYTQ